MAVIAKNKALCVATMAALKVACAAKETLLQRLAIFFAALAACESGENARAWPGWNHDP